MTSKSHENSALNNDEQRAADIPDFSDSYDTARQHLCLFSALLLAWELIGIEFIKDKPPLPVFNINFKSPDAFPYVLIVLIVYFAYRMTVEWYQSDSRRRGLVASRIDICISYLIGLASMLVYSYQKAFKIQIANDIAPYTLPSLGVGLILGIATVSATANLMVPRLRSTKKAVIAMLSVPVLLFLLSGLMLKWVNSLYATILFYGSVGISIPIVLSIIVTFRRAIRWQTVIPTYRVVSALTGWVALGLSFYDITEGTSGMAWLLATVNYFSYFTILSNILVALSLTYPLLMSQSCVGKFFDRPTVKTAITAYIIVTGLVYYCFVGPLVQWHGLANQISDVLLHYVMPTLYVTAWLAFEPKGQLLRRNVFYWLVFPLIYLFYTVVRGGFTGYYPYQFINAAQLGYAQILLNCLLLLLGLVLLGLLLVQADRGMGKIRRGAPLVSKNE